MKWKIHEYIQYQFFLYPVPVYVKTGMEFLFDFFTF